MWLRRADSLHSVCDDWAIVDTALPDCAQALLDKLASPRARAGRPVWHRWQRPRTLRTIQPERVSGGIVSGSAKGRSPAVG